jgi:hypothetical protein
MKRIFLLSMVVLMLLIMVTAGTPIAAAQDQAVEPAAGPAGTSFSFHIGSFDRSEQLAYWWCAPHYFIQIHIDIELQVMPKIFQPLIATSSA